MRKGKNKLVEEQWRVYLLHREFVRRNPEYGEQYRECRSKWGEFNKEFPLWMWLYVDWGLAKDEALPDPDVYPDLDKVVRKATLLDDFPKVPYAGNAMFAKALNVFPVQEGKGPESFEQLKGMLFLTYFQEQASRFPKIYVLDMRWPKVRLMNEFEQWLDWMLYEQSLVGLRQKPNEKRLRLSEYLKYLKVYDLRKKRN